MLSSKSKSIKSPRDEEPALNSPISSFRSYTIDTAGGEELTPDESYLQSRYTHDYSQRRVSFSGTPMTHSGGIEDDEINSPYFNQYNNTPSSNHNNISSENEEYSREKNLRNFEYETSLFERHSTICKNWQVNVTASEGAQAGSRYRVNLELIDYNGKVVCWVIRQRYNAFEKIYETLKDRYSSIAEFKFPGKSLWHSESVQTNREKAFEELTRKLVRLYPVPSEAIEFLDLSEPQVNTALQSFPIPEHPKITKKGFEKNDNEDIEPTERTELDESSILDSLSAEKLQNLKSKFVKLEYQHTIVADIFIIGCVVFAAWCFKLIRIHGIQGLFMTLIPQEIALFFQHLWVVLNFSCYIVLILIFFHRGLAWFLGYYLTNLLGEEHGAYHFTFGWVTIRLGLDHNEIIIKDFIWLNPTCFDQTPYFLKVSKLSITFDPWSIYRALYDNKEIILHSIEIDGLTAFIEKIEPEIAVFAKTNEMNLWAALGAGPGDDSAGNVKNDLLAQMSAAMKVTTRASAGMAKAILSFSILKPFRFTRSFFTKKPNKRASRNRSKSENNDIDDDDNNNNNNNVDDTNKNYKDNDESDSDSNSDFGSDSDSDSDSDDDSEEAKREMEKAVEDAWADWHWGIPYPIICNRLLVREVTAYAADFIQTKGEKVKAKDKKKLKVNLIDMRARTLRNTSKHRKTRGLFFDELAWRLIGKLISEILVTNSGSLAYLAGSVAISNTSQMIQGTMSSINTNLTEAYVNYNPVQVIRKTFGSASKQNIKPSLFIAQTPELQEMNIKTLRIVVEGLHSCKRYDGKRVKLCQAQLSLINQNTEVRCETSVRRSNQYFSTPFNETFEMGPVLSLTTRLRIRIIHKSLSSGGLCLCWLEVDVGDRNMVGLREWKEVNVNMIPGDCHGFNALDKRNVHSEIRFKAMLY